jgi:hypothetical protein
MNAGLAVAAAARILPSSPEIVEQWRRVKSLDMKDKMVNDGPPCIRLH